MREPFFSTAPRDIARQADAAERFASATEAIVTLAAEQKETTRNAKIAAIAALIAAIAAVASAICSIIGLIPK